MPSSFGTEKVLGECPMGDPVINRRLGLGKKGKKVHYFIHVEIISICS